MPDVETGKPLSDAEKQTASEAAQLAADGNMEGYGVKLAELIAPWIAAAQLSELENLRRIAKKAMAWKTADGVWVYDNDKVYSCGNENRMPTSPFRPWHFSITADQLEPNLKKFYYSTPEAAEKAARAEFANESEAAK